MNAPAPTSHGVPRPLSRRLASLPPAALLLAGCLLALAACGGESTYEITEVRKVPAAPASSGAVSPHGAPPGDAAMQPEWRYDLPAGWSVMPPSPMRALGFEVGGREDATCTFSVLSGSGGGVLANVNRWRKQMTLEPVAEEALAKLPKRTFLQREGIELDLEGTYVGMGGGEPVEGARMLGWIVEEGGAAAFLKFVGPKDVVEAEKASFEKLGTTLRLEMPAARSGMGELPPGHPPMDGAQDAPAPAPQRRSSLSWKEPEGWERKPPRSMREVTLVPPGAERAQLYVSILGGSGGGLAGNLNRWRQQMGQEPLSEAEIGALPRLESLGREGVMIVIQGNYQGMGAAATDGAAMLGFVVERPEDSVFVKMIGPSQEVLPHQAAFEAFCRSLSE